MLPVAEKLFTIFENLGCEEKLCLYRKSQKRFLLCHLNL